MPPTRRCSPASPGIPQAPPRRPCRSAPVRDHRAPRSRTGGCALTRGAGRLSSPACPKIDLMLQISRTLTLPDTELTERFLRADGPGGQHVNRTESAVELRFDVAGSASLPEEIRVRLLARRDRRLTAEGTLVIQGRRFRDQGRNRDDVRERLAELVRGVLVPPK